MILAGSLLQLAVLGLPPKRVNLEWSANGFEDSAPPPSHMAFHLAVSEKHGGFRRDSIGEWKNTTSLQLFDMSSPFLSTGTSYSLAPFFNCTLCYATPIRFPPGANVTFTSYVLMGAWWSASRFNGTGEYGGRLCNLWKACAYNGGTATACDSTTAASTVTTFYVESSGRWLAANQLTVMSQSMSVNTTIDMTGNWTSPPDVSAFEIPRGINCVSWAPPSVASAPLDSREDPSLPRSPVWAPTPGRPTAVPTIVSTGPGLPGPRRASRDTEPVQLGGVPHQFDARVQWPGCIGAVLDTTSHGAERCSDNWAFVSAQALSDRRCVERSHRGESISSQGTPGGRTELSAQYLQSCAVKNHGCRGGQLDFAWEFMRDSGLPPATCINTSAMPARHEPCPTQCDDGSKLPQLTRAAAAFTPGQEAATIMGEIAEHGPVVATFFVPLDFKDGYSGGVYSWNGSGEMGQLKGNAKLLGWGVTPDGAEYWIGQATFGTAWGEAGFFRIKRGTEELAIEAQVSAG
jgi:hypothetical protein